ncbi:MAG: hypothetical protein J0G32_08155 [Alphaproteobacteria bacterium]|nr:hypothetical protein [Alphaproteobacteria bacterium]OJV15110.1 MAG: hypothetical protein BGO27_06700 [Alphaproteobacteria bacterium 33-17]
MVDSISNLALQKSLIKDINDTKKSVATLQKQISSGRAVDTYLDLTETGRVEGVINLESKINDLDSYITNNNIVTGRLRATDIAMSSIIDNLMDYRAVMVKRRSAVGNQDEMKITVREVGKSLLGIIRDNLNTRYEGQFLFSGARIDQEAVGDIVNNTNYLHNEVTANYYLGDAVTRTVRASDSLVVSYGIKADDLGFQKAIAAIHIVMAAETEEQVEEAFDMMSEAISAVINIRNNVGNAMTQVTQTMDIQETVQTYFTTTLSDLTATKIEEASIKLSNDMAVLMGAFQSFSMVSKLNLTDYLR